MLAASALVAIGPPAAVAAPGPVVQPAAAVTADRLPTVQVDGVVWSQAVVGNTVYAGGSFDNARPAGRRAGHQPDAARQPARLRHHDRQPHHVVRPRTSTARCSSVAASPDGTRIYVVGDFTTANGQARRRVAAYSTATGALIIAVQPERSQLAGPRRHRDQRPRVRRRRLPRPRQRHAAQQPRGLPRLRRRRPAAGTPNADYTVWAHRRSPATAPRSSPAGRSRTSAASPPTAWPRSTRPPARWTPAGGRRSATPARTPASAACGCRASFVYGTTWHFGPGGNLEGTFKSPVDGAPTPPTSSGSPTATATPTPATWPNGIVYVAGHAHYCGNMGGGFPQYSQWKFQHAQAWTDTVNPAGSDILNDVHGYPNWHGVEPGPSLVNWLPDMAMGSFTGQYQAGWNVTGNSDYVVVRRRVPVGQRRRPAGPGPLRRAADRPGGRGPALRRRLPRAAARARCRPRPSGSAGRPATTATAGSSRTG